MLNRILGYFITGLVLILPMVLTIWLIYYLVSIIQDLFSFERAAVGLGVTLILIVFIGYLITLFSGDLLWDRLEKSLIKLPLIGLIYKAIKDVTTAFVGTENRFSEPVLVKFTEEEVYKIGFITNRQISSLLNTNIESSKDLVAVYFPLSFSLSGDLYLVEKHRVIPIQSKAKDVMQIVVSGGIIKADSIKPQ